MIKWLHSLKHEKMRQLALHFLSAAATRMQSDNFHLSTILFPMLNIMFPTIFSFKSSRIWFVIIILNMKNTALLLFVVCAANAAIFTSYSNNPGQSSQPSNIWNQPTWNQPSYTPPSSWDNTAQNSDQFPQDTPFVGSSADNSEDDIKKQYSDFKLKNGKSYSATTDNYRYGVFSSNVRKINAHNSDPTQTYKKEVNKFADLTDQ